MKLAIFSDIHGNYHALEAILDDAQRQGADQIICAGDVVNPFPDSRRAWEQVRALNIPTVRGNHEDYMLAMDDPEDRAGMQGKVQFLPVQVTAATMPSSMIADMAALPMTLSISGPGGDDVLVCHGSPDQTRRSFSQVIDDEMAASLNRHRERVIVGGHIHQQWYKHWQGKLLLLCGGGGLPLNGSTTAQYLLLTHQGGQWEAEHRAVDYDHAGLLRSLLEQDFLIKGGPIAWLFYDELLTAERRMIPFFEFTGQGQHPDTLAGWQGAVQRYLKSIGRWAVIRPSVGEAVEAVSSLY